MKTWFATAALAISLPAQAEIYRCVINGTPSYAAEPLCEDAQLMEYDGLSTIRIGSAREPQSRNSGAEQQGADDVFEAVEVEAADSVDPSLSGPDLSRG